MSHLFRLTLLSCFAITLSAQSEPGIVSVEELRKPLKGKALHAILRAQEHLKSGESEKGIAELRDAMGDPDTMPLALGMLGAEHLKTGQLDVALGELEQAVQLLPGRPELHSNLAYALYLKGQTERGLKEVHRALQLDAGKPKTRLVLGMLLLQQGAHDAEALQHLQAAAEEIPGAHLVLARHYDQAGQAREAEKERRAYNVVSMGLLAAK